MKEKIAPGKYVSMTYMIKDESGSLVEQNDIPVGYVFGGDVELLGGMDDVLAGHSAGEEISSEIPAEKAFGDYNPDLTFTDDIENVPEQYRHIGAEVQMHNEKGESRTFYVSKIENGRLTVDGNHPLAGKKLQLIIRILDVREATAEDIKKSEIHSSNSPTLN